MADSPHNATLEYIFREISQAVGVRVVRAIGLRDPFELDETGSTTDRGFYPGLITLKIHPTNERTQQGGESYNLLLREFLSK